METITVIAPDITCEHCKRTIESAVRPLPGVHDVQVEVPTKTVQVRFDPVLISRAAIENLLDEEGYPVATTSTAPREAPRA